MRPNVIVMGVAVWQKFRQHPKVISAVYAMGGNAATGGTASKQQVAALFEVEEVIVGEIALENARLRAERVAQFVKNHMGDDWRREFNGQVHTPESLSAIILAHLIREAEPQIGPIPSAVISQARRRSSSGAPIRLP